MSTLPIYLSAIIKNDGPSFRVAHVQPILYAIGHGVLVCMFKKFHSKRSDSLTACTSKPVINQIEVNPFLFRAETLAFFASEGIVIEAYRALRNGKEMDNEAIAAVAKKHGVSVPQVSK